MSQVAKKAICPGSFDPPSYGHINIIERCLKVFDHVTVAIAADNEKASVLSTEERVDIFNTIFKDQPRVEIECFEGLLVDYARSKDVSTLVRGIRTVADYEYELQMSLANRMLDPQIETIFMMTEARFSHISSSVIKQVIALKGSGKEMIPPFVEEKLKAKLFGKEPQ